jgi:hypothetical protein
MMEESKGCVAAGKIFFLILIVFFLLVSAEMAHSQSIRLLIPDGGESLVIGQEKYISWTSSGLSADVKVKLELFQNRRRIGTISSNRSIRPEETVAWKWKVGQYQGGTAAPGSGYYIHITTMDGQYTDRSDRHFELVARKHFVETKPQIVGKKPQRILPDFKIRNVRHDYQHKKLRVYFDGGLGKYQGPLVFNVVVRNTNIIIQKRNMVWRDNRIEDFSLDLEWPGTQTPYLNVSVKINPDCQIKERNCNNNLYEGRIFENSTDFKLLGDGMCFPKKSIFWSREDKELCDGAVFLWTERDVKNAIQRGELEYFDPYDPDCNTLISTAKVWIGNFSGERGTAHVAFKFVSYNGIRTVERHISFLPGEKKFVEASIMLNLQRKNFIEAWVRSRSSVERVRVEIEFLGLPYDLD